MKRLDMRQIMIRVLGVAMPLVAFVPLVTWSPGAWAQGQASTSDTRQRLRLTPAESESMRAAMRQMVASVNAVLHGLAADNLAVVEEAATGSGLAAAVGPDLEQKLPRQFLELGERTHRAFDELASAARAPVAAKDLMKRLAGVTSNCVACHANYRLDDTR